MNPICNTFIKPDISVIVPVWKEQGIIRPLIWHIRRIAGSESLEIIIADGDPDQETTDAVRDQGVITIRSDRGRAVQMNAGADIASGRILLFLHADTFLPENGFRRIRQICESARCIGGAFDLEIDDPGWTYRIIGTAASWRSRITRIPYGDQAVFIKKDIFFNIGKFNNMPLMEDADLMRRLKSAHYPIRFIRERVRTSARKWRQDGVMQRTIRNWQIFVLYLLKVRPDYLVRLYYRETYNREAARILDEAKREYSGLEKKGYTREQAFEDFTEARNEISRYL